MYLIVIAWMYVVLMMSIAEATNINGTILGALVTFFMYGVGPVALVVYLMGAPARSKAIKQREAPTRTQSRQMATAMRPVVCSPLPPTPRLASRRWEKNLEGLLTVHHGRLPSLP
jgi:uncharacterized membrane protein